MFGISIYEFLVILVVAMMVIPVRHWPDVARFLARAVKFIRDIVWKITDAGEQIRDRIDREVPINDMIKKTTDDVIGAFSTPKTKGRRQKAEVK